MLGGAGRDGAGMKAIDLNCDMGEGMETDARIFPFISSANIACGFHAGDMDIMRRTVDLALRHGVAIGAHPSYPDRPRFGRVDMLEAGPGVRDGGKGGPGGPESGELRPGSIRYEELGRLVTDQLDILRGVCEEFGTRMHHVKLHGALYNRAARDEEVSRLICRAIAEFDPSLLIYGLSGSVMGEEARKAGVGFVSEVFADRTYRPDGSLTPRTEPDALIEDEGRAVEQALMMMEGRVRAGTQMIGLVAETICLHGDGSHAVEFAMAIRGALEGKGMRVGAP